MIAPERISSVYLQSFDFNPVVKTQVQQKQLREALTIRRVEEKFLELFSLGKLNGTVHTCVGQEFSAVAFAGQLRPTDFIFSNHRCHGHFISFTKDVRGLLAELMGKRSGVSGGVGSSQHLCKDNFFSNGIQGGIVPVAAGYALAHKLREADAIGTVFIGDGTLGEGALYETMNIVSKWEIPLLIVCENNFYAQSTPQSINLAGTILDRPAAFGIQTFEGDTWHPTELTDGARRAIDFVRTNRKPAFYLVNTYRLNAHSKGDDDRAKEEVQEFRSRDYLHTFEQDFPEEFLRMKESVDKEINAFLAEIEREEDLPLDEYYKPLHEQAPANWLRLESFAQRQVELINEFFRQQLVQRDDMIFMGEDVLSPYGGAFKVSRELSDLRNDRVFSTPISEAAIMGIANGLALNGFKPFAEVMFGDFVTLAFDQLVNHASKFFHIFNLQVKCPVVLRTPMGGRRGYGPTHSQTLDKFLIGIDNVKTVALNALLDPRKVYASVAREEHPVVVIENKIDYGKKIAAHRAANYRYTFSDEAYPIVKISPIISTPDLTLVTYGGMADIVNGCLDDIFMETELKVDLIVLTQLSPLPLSTIVSSVEKTGRLAVVEEGSLAGGIGSEVLASVLEAIRQPIVARRIGALPVPIPSVKSLEQQVLPDKQRIISELNEYFR